MLLPDIINQYLAHNSANAPRQLLAAFITFSVLAVGLTAAADNTGLTEPQEVELQTKPATSKDLGSHLSQVKDSLKNNRPEHNALLGATLGGLLTANPAGIFLGGAVAGAITGQDSHAQPVEEIALYDGITPSPLVITQDDTKNQAHSEPSPAKKAPLESNLKTSPLNLTYMTPSNNLPTFSHLAAPPAEPIKTAAGALPAPAPAIKKSKEPTPSGATQPTKALAQATSHPAPPPTKAKHMASQKPKEPTASTSKEGPATKAAAQTIKEPVKIAAPVLPASCFDRSDNHKRERPRHCFYMLY